MRVGVLIFRCQSEQPTRLGIVFRTAFSFKAHPCKRVLRVCVPLICCQPEQPTRLDQVFGPVLAVVPLQAELMLRLRVR